MKKKNNSAYGSHFEDASKKSFFVHYTRGKLITASVRSARVEGLILNVAGVSSAVMSTKAFGSGEARLSAIRKMAPGTRVVGRVVGYYPQTSQLTLEYVSTVSKTDVMISKSSQTKPEYAVIAPGSTILVDSANVLGQTGAESAEEVLRGIHTELEERGYKPMLFIENRCFGWAMHNQSSPARAESLSNALRELKAVFSARESDSTLLMCAAAMKDALVVTNDGLFDYRTAFPEIVGTSRVRSFSCVKLEDRFLVSIDGLNAAIDIPTKSPDELADFEACDEMPKNPRFGADAKKGAMSEMAHGDIERGLGHKDKAMRSYKRAMRNHIPEAYRAVAEMYAEDDTESVKQAKHFAKLAAKAERKSREMKRRDARCARLAYEQRLVRIGHRLIAA